MATVERITEKSSMTMMSKCGLTVLQSVDHLFTCIKLCITTEYLINIRFFLFCDILIYFNTWKKN